MKSKTIILLLAAAGIWGHSDAQHHASESHKAGENVATQLKAPAAMVVEHKEIHKMLDDATQLPGKTGEAAQALLKVMGPHFIKEEEYALPPLGILPLLAEGKALSGADRKSAIAMTDKLKADLPGMLQDHKMVVLSLNALVEAAEAENHPEVIEFAKKLKLHAETEEEVSYPAAILVGKYLKLKH